jgi:hypothetical protein
VVFGGQTMLRAKMRFDERATPIAVDHFALSGPQKGTVTSGIMEWVGDQIRFLTATGEPRPNDSTSSNAKGHSVSGDDGSRQYMTAEADATDRCPPVASISSRLSSKSWLRAGRIVDMTIRPN